MENLKTNYQKSTETQITVYPEADLANIKVKANVSFFLLSIAKYEKTEYIIIATKLHVQMFKIPAELPKNIRELIESDRCVSYGDLIEFVMHFELKQPKMFEKEHKLESSPCMVLTKKYSNMYIYHSQSLDDNCFDDDQPVMQIDYVNLCQEAWYAVEYYNQQFEEEAIRDEKRWDAQLEVKKQQKEAEKIPKEQQREPEDKQKRSTKVTLQFPAQEHKPKPTFQDNPKTSQKEQNVPEKDSVKYPQIKYGLIIQRYKIDTSFFEFLAGKQKATIIVTEKEFVVGFNSDELRENFIGETQRFQWEFQIFTNKNAKIHETIDKEENAAKEPENKLLDRIKTQFSTIKIGAVVTQKNINKEFFQHHVCTQVNGFKDLAMFDEKYFIVGFDSVENRQAFIDSKQHQWTIQILK
ncbi:Hypothetical_protein [Hexamita inflata]|uniref:Hypothetical_protein n=1 Tax=Hexamita inflata TaxID=28002 RepID=A0AA86QZU2_9EUKA|nr:Hypothetical protein HINF_LOCUS45591 [Hexamita inflata]CAI9969089.1 Hypothetical protein HINF_LOCUS56734 [Hexamita inflata]